MDWKVFLTIFAAVFIAELGDKTQLATMLFAADKEVNKTMVFFAASAALIVASAIGVLAGALLSEFINEKYLHYIAGTGFVATRRGSGEPHPSQRCYVRGRACWAMEAYFGGIVVIPYERRPYQATDER